MGSINNTKNNSTSFIKNNDGNKTVFINQEKEKILKILKVVKIIIQKRKKYLLLIQIILNLQMNLLV